MKCEYSNKPCWSEPNRDALWFTVQPWALRKSKEAQIKSDLIRWLHWARWLKPFVPQCINSLEMTPFGKCNRTRDTLAIVWFWQVSNLMYIPYCVSAVAETILITFHTRCMHICVVLVNHNQSIAWINRNQSLLVIQFNLILLSTIKQQLNKQGVFSGGLDTGSVEHCQMTA